MSAHVCEYLLRLRAPSSVCGVCERGKMYIVGCHGLLKVSGTTPFVYQLLMTLLHGDDVTAGACDEATAGNDASRHW